jgi:hypothetical protein
MTIRDFRSELKGGLNRFALFRKVVLSMSIYDPLCEYLKRQSLREITLTFAELERILNRKLPPSAQRPQWWANVRSASGGHTQRTAWRDAGFDAFLIAGSKKVKFKKV